MQEWPLTGRTEELTVLADVLSGDREYAGVAVTGAAGVGKTRLAREAAGLATSLGWTVRWVVGTAAAQLVPLGAFAQWTDGLDGHPLQLVGSVITAVTVTTSNEPVLVCVDDAHRLDDLSAFVVHQLVLRGSTAVIATIRTGEAVPDAVTALWKDGHVARLDVQPLSRTQSATLLGSVLGGKVAERVAERAWQLSNGNVLYLHEIVNHELQAGRLASRAGQWLWEGPISISTALAELVDLQLGATTQPILDVLDLVALAEPLELPYLTALADAQAIEDCERRGLIAVSPSSPSDVARLSHPLFGEVRLARAGRWRLARLRGRIANTIMTTNPTVGPADPVRLALLWRDSDLPPDAGVLNRAAQVALQRLDLVLASELAHAAVNAGAGVDAEILLANLYSVMSRGDEAEALLAALTTRELPEAAWTTAVSLRAANLLWSLNRADESWAVIDDAVAVASSTSSPDLLAFKTVQLASAAQPEKALSTSELIDGDQLRPLPAMMLAWGLTIALGDLGRPQDAATVAAEGAAIAASSPEVAFQAIGLTILHAHALVVGGYPEAATVLAERTRLEFTDVPGAPRTNATAIDGVAALANGDVHTAAALLGAALTEFAASGSSVGTDYHFGIANVQALALTGDVARAQEALDWLHENRHRAFEFVEPDLLLAAAWVAAAGGHLTQARALAAKAAEFTVAHGQHAREVSCLQAAIQFGERNHHQRLTDLAQRVKGPRAQLVSRWAAALADHDGDALIAVSGDLDAMGDRIAAADAAAHAALAFSRGHRRGANLTAAAQAARIIGACSAITPATRAAASPLPLSEREREVALLVSEGKSNKEIAASLTVSVRTIEGHIYQACRKLGAENRAELARVLRRT